MTTTTKNTRREEWKKRNFAGSIDWAVDLQSFTADEYKEDSLERTKAETCCVMGEDVTLDSGSLCAFSCMYGFCPESLCECIAEDEMESLPPKQANVDDIVAYDENNVDLNRLCKWACQYGYCPDDICIKSEPEIDTSIPEVGDLDDYFNATEAKNVSSGKTDGTGTRKRNLVKKYVTIRSKRRKQRVGPQIMAAWAFGPARKRYHGSSPSVSTRLQQDGACVIIGCSTRSLIQFSRQCQ
jgi:hypothetical protein